MAIGYVSVSLAVPLQEPFVSFSLRAFGYLSSGPALSLFPHI
jgi:hypothetical protein